MKARERVREPRRAAEAARQRAGKSARWVAGERPEAREEEVVAEMAPLPDGTALRAVPEQAGERRVRGAD